MAMALAPTSPHCILTGRPLCTALPRPSRRSPSSLLFKLSCKASGQEDAAPERKSRDVKFAKLAMVAVAAGVLALGSVDGAVAAKSGGRIGGQGFRSAPPPRSAGPRMNNSRTNIYINPPPVAPPLIGGYGYGGPFFGGWGWSPFTYFAPGPSVAVGVGGGFDVFVTFLMLGVVVGAIRRLFSNRADDDYDDY